MAQPNEPQPQQPATGADNVIGRFAYLSAGIRQELAAATLDEFYESLGKEKAPPEEQLAKFQEMRKMINEQAAAAFSATPPAPYVLTYMRDFLNEITVSEKPVARKTPLRLFRPSARERLKSWEMLFERTLVFASVSNKQREIQEIEQEYEFLRVWQNGMVVWVALYQVAIMLLISGTWLFMTYLPPVSKQLYLARPFLTSAYWGAMGACTASLWQLLTKAGDRTVRLQFAANHRIKPTVGAFFGALVCLLATARVGIANLDSMTAIWAGAALAGLFENKVMRKLFELTSTLFGTSQAAPEKSAPAGK